MGSPNGESPSLQPQCDRIESELGEGLDSNPTKPEAHSQQIIGLSRVGQEDSNLGKMPRCSIPRAE